MKTSQCFSLGDLCHSSLADECVEEKQCRTRMSSTEIAMTMSNLKLDFLSEMPDDVLFQILLHCGPYDSDESVKHVCRRLHKVTSLSLELWKEFCSMTGKALEKNLANETTTKKISYQQDNSISCDNNFYRRYYFRNPCVPVDFESINEALKFCPRNDTSGFFPIEDDDAFYSDHGSVVLMPGTHRERIIINGEPWAEGRPLKSVAIRAAFPSIGAALVHYEGKPVNELKNQPSIAISTLSSSTLEPVEKEIFVRLSHLKILHSTPGADIWGGNTAVLIDGPKAHVVIDSCIIQSDSGRGLVVTNRASVQMTDSSIVDCAATGFYLGDWCGFGDTRQQVLEVHRAEVDMIMNHFETHARTGRPIPSHQIDVVPPGHSGLYIESSIAWVEDTLIAGNCLTGLSVVRNGFVSLSGSDITENGNGNARAEQVMIEDAHDVRDQNRLPINIRGGVVEGPLANNYVSRAHANDRNVYKGGKIRSVRHRIKEPTALSLLREDVRERSETCMVFLHN
ncbi:hypothetical protein HJC23_011121 [Cyclotella cryptica]|uniref:F-box domain-containing protein n=1 Tax=Cyclotella cryptica TaxID=29204 RepID=A0ABD3PW62_9STRA